MLARFRPPIERCLRFVAAWVAALVLVGVVDAVNITLRGGGWAHFGGLGWVASAAWGIGLGTALLALGLGALARLLAWPVGRWWPGHRLAHPHPWMAGILAMVFAAALFPAHALFATHVAGALLTSAYAVVPIYLICLWFLGALQRAPATVRRHRVAFMGVAAAAALGVHAFNAAVYTHLYPGLHAAQSGLTVAILVVALGREVAAWSLRSVGVVAVLGALLVPLGGLGDPARTRGSSFFFGTELQHFHAALEWALDRDGDGFSAVLGGGDCDDTDPQRHPLARDLPGDGVDQDCSGADHAPAPHRPRVEPPPPAELAAWRAAHPRPDIVVFFIDTLRADHVGAFGGSAGPTPHLDALAARGVVFEQARSPVPRTPHALMSVLRGRFLGRVTGEGGAIEPPGETLVRALWRSGYTTGTRLVGQNWAKYHLESGWDRLVKGSSIGRRHGHEVTRSAIELIDAAKSPYFLMFHYADPHAPYAPGSSESMRARYADEVRFTDAQVGEVLAHLRAAGRLDRTLVVVFADHGEDLGDHGGSGGHHGVSLFDEVVRVPLIIAAPGIAPRRVSGGVSLADVAPTLLDLVGGPALPTPDGCSLVGPLFGVGAPPAFTLSEFYDHGLHLRAIEADGHKLIVDVRRNAHLLFDLTTDPLERIDLADEHPDRVAHLQATLTRWVEASDAPAHRCRTDSP